MADPAREILNLLHIYAERVDAGDFAGVGALFEHGRIAGTPDAKPEHAIAGFERVHELYRSTVRVHADGKPRTKHVTTNSIIEVDEAAGTASASSYFTVFQQLDDFPLQPIVSGRYADTFHVVDGSWWFDTRVMHVEFVGNMSRHLLIGVKT